jgi:farnesyl diphosphate synthase
MRMVSYVLPGILIRHEAHVQFGVEDQAQYDAALKILIPLGEYFQIQDDYLDAFADPEVLGKVGTDILVCPSSTHHQSN